MNSPLMSYSFHRLAGQLTPSIYQDQVKAFQRAGDCFQYKCGRSSSNNRRT